MLTHPSFSKIYTVMCKMNTKYTKEYLEPIVLSSKSWAEVCRKIGIKPNSGSQSHIKSRAVKFVIDFSHFTGMGWNKGGISVNRRDVSWFLKENFPVGSDYLKKRLLKEKLKEHVCEDCGLAEWMGKPIPLELHHIDKNHNNNFFSNIKIVCPNCHALYNSKLP